MVLAILEVSQKQAYIFRSKKLKENYRRSEQIRKVTEPQFINNLWPDYDEAANLVYSGGGNIVLRFDDLETARAVMRKATYEAYNSKDFGFELFAKIKKYPDNGLPKDVIKDLKQELEKKKSLRSSAFRRLETGLEVYPYVSDRKGADKTNKSSNDEEDTIRKGCTKYDPKDMSDLVGRDNFCAVIHIDGNNMGAKVDEVTEKGSNIFEAGANLRKLSGEIEKAFSGALTATMIQVEKWQNDGLLEESLGFAKDKKYHPFRRIIEAGDDICFIVPAKIALECAAFYLRWLSDNSEFSACAGIAMVHEKYPFHRAYEMSEALCSSAKRYAAGLGDEVSAIDWHIEYGQAKSGLGAIREDYLTFESESGRDADHPVRTLTLRPLAMTETENGSRYRAYGYMRELAGRMKDKSIAKSKIKGLRTSLKNGESSTKRYLIENSMTDLAKLAYTADTRGDLKAAFENGGRDVLISIDDKEQIGGQTVYYRRSLYFDAIELMDKFVRLDKTEQEAGK